MQDRWACDEGGGRGCRAWVSGVGVGRDHKKQVLLAGCDSTGPKRQAGEGEKASPPERARGGDARTVIIAWRCSVSVGGCGG